MWHFSDQEAQAMRGLAQKNVSISQRARGLLGDPRNWGNLFCERGRAK